LAIIAWTEGKSRQLDFGHVQTIERTTVLVHTQAKWEKLVKSVHILAPGPMMPMVLDKIGETFTLHRLWEMADKERFIAEQGASIRGMIVGGHVKIDGPYLKQFPNTEIIANFGVGYDSVDAKFAGENKIIVTNTPDVLTEEVADTCLGLLLMTVRELPHSERWLRAGHWVGKGPYPLTHTSLRTMKVGIFGLGRIGKAIAHRLEAFGAAISYHNRRQVPDVPYTYYPTLTGLAEAVDILISVAPGGPQTHHIINADVFKALGPKGIFINIGRGSAVDEQAMIAALRDKVIWSAGLDVFEHEPKVPAELIALENTVLLPHVGSATHHTRGLMGQLVVDNITQWFSGKGPVTPVAETPWKG
jgi:lactate dehydrogenase-like 2-hydroxyacid dehydrogenase